MKRRRTNEVMRVLHAVSSPRGADAEAVRANETAQLAAIMRSNRALTAAAADAAGMPYIGRMSCDDFISLKATTGLPWSALRLLASFIRTHHAPVFPPECDVRRRIIARHLRLPTFTGKLDGGAPFLLIDHVWDVLRDATLERWRGGQLVWWPSQQHNTLDIVIGIDKGGRSTKLQALWVNTLQPQSSLSALLLGMYEGPEDYELLADCFRTLLATLDQPRGLPWSAAAPAEWPATDSGSLRARGDCKECGGVVPVRLPALLIEDVRFFYNGDTVLLNKVEGLSGHSSCHPCPSCAVNKDALDYDPQRIHSLGALGGAAPPWRSLDALDAHHDDFVLVSGSDRKRARLHENVVRPSLIATPITAHIVPPVLHIITGVATMLFDYIEKRCRAFDEQAPAGDSTAPFTQSLRAAIRAHGVLRSPPYDQLSGDGQRRFLSNADDFVAALQQRVIGGVTIGDSTEHRKALVELLTELHSIARLVLVARPLCDHDVDDLQARTDGLAIQWHRFFVGRALTPKLHMLFIDVPRFARQHRMVTTLRAPHSPPPPPRRARCADRGTCDWRRCR